MVTSVNAWGGPPDPRLWGDTLRGATPATNPIRVGGLVFNAEESPRAGV